MDLCHLPPLGPQLATPKPATSCSLSQSLGRCVTFYFTEAVRHPPPIFLCLPPATVPLRPSFPSWGKVALHPGEGEAHLYPGRLTYVLVNTTTLTCPELPGRISTCASNIFKRNMHKTKLFSQ